MPTSKNTKSKKSLLLLVGALALACATALVARSLLRPPPPVTIIKQVAAPQVVKTAVLVATRDIKPGEFVSPALFTWHEQDEKQTTGLQFSAKGTQARQGIERQLAGAAFRQTVIAGAPLERTAIVSSGEAGFIGAVLTPGMRAVSIPTNAVASNAGLVSAGDWVDVILSLERDKVPATETNPASRLAAQTILHKVRVLALNNNTESITPVADKPEAKETDSKTSSQRTARPYYESLTLEVTPADAERLAVAREVGALQVALRSVRDIDTRQHGGMTRLNDTTSIVPGKSGTVKTFQGNQQGILSFQ